LESTNDISAELFWENETNTISQVLAAMWTNPGTAKEIAYRTGMEVSVVEAVLDFLFDYGLIRREGSRMVVERELAGLPAR
jgi:DNA-binding MarR family transcriptional regulator